MGADLYESYVGSVLSASALGAFAGMGERGFIIPFLIAVAGVLASVIGTFLCEPAKTLRSAPFFRHSGAACMPQPA